MSHFDPEKLVALMNSKYIDYIGLNNFHSVFYELRENKDLFQKVDLHHLMDFRATYSKTACGLDMYYYAESLLKDALDKKDFDLAIKIANVSYDTYDFDERSHYIQTDALEEIYNQLEKVGDIDHIEKLLNSKAFTTPSRLDIMASHGDYERTRIEERYYDVIKKQAKHLIGKKLTSKKSLNSEDLKNQVIDLINTKLPTITLNNFKKDLYIKDLLSYAANKFAESGFYKESGELLAQSQKSESQEQNETANEEDKE